MSDDSDVDVQKQLTDALAKLEQASARVTALEQENKRLEREGRAAQRAAARLNVPLTPAKVPGTAGKQGQQEPPPEAAGNEKIVANSLREAAWLRALTARGLRPDDEDVVDVPIETLASQFEIETAVNQILLNRKVSDLGKRIERPAEDDKSSDEVIVDTGGQHIGEAARANSDDLRQMADDFRSKGRYTEAAWAVLRAAHNDPTKRLVSARKTED